jgi:hypothetical protein
LIEAPRKHRTLRNARPQAITKDDAQARKHMANRIDAVRRDVFAAKPVRGASPDKARRDPLINEP